MSVVAPPATNPNADKGRITVTPEGYFLFKGEKYSLFQLIQIVLVEHAQVISKSVAGELQVMNDMTQNYKVCSELKEAIQGIRPTSSDGTVDYLKVEMVAEKLVRKYPEMFSFFDPFDPKNISSDTNKVSTTDSSGKPKKYLQLSDAVAQLWKKFGVSDIADGDASNGNITGDKWTQQKVDQLIEGLRSNLSSVGQDQDSQKVRLQRGLHAQDETWNLLSATEKTITQNTEQIIQRV